MSSEWVNVNDKLPPDDFTVDTIIFDREGDRNHQKLKRRDNLWFFPDGSMYVYYTPTHWREIA